MMGLKMTDNNKFDTDKDIIAFAKSLFLKNRIASSLILFFSLNELNGKEEFDPPKVFKYAENNVDDMVVKLFDLSLTSKISAVYPSREWCGKYGGFDMVIVPSRDCQTNITSKLIDFFQVLVNPFALDYLKEPFRGNLVEQYNPPSWGDFFAPLTPYNPWEQFE
jgi:hypothetical protein